MSAKTVKRLAILIGILSLVGGAGFFRHRFQVEKLGRSVLRQAERAEQAREFATAEKLYEEHAQIFPEDVDAELKRADAILKADPSSSRQNEALRIYSAIVGRYPGHEQARRRRMELKVELGRLVSSPQSDDGADVDLQVLLQEHKQDGHLLFLQGQCYEAAEKFQEAAENYKKAAKHEAPKPNAPAHQAPEDKAARYKAPEWIEASQRHATVLRDRLEDPGKADQAIDAMVNQEPENYEVYLARGRYRFAGAKGDSKKALLADAREDFEKARQLAPGEPKIYLELAKIAEQASGPDEARRILDVGLKAAPTSIALYQSLANLELRTGRLDDAVQVLRNGVKSIPAARSLHWVLADILARRGETDKLRKEIEDLELLGYLPIALQYLKAHYFYNINDFSKARANLAPLQLRKDLTPEYKVQINMLLAQCYNHLGDAEMEEDANRRVLRADPHNVNARLATIATLVKQGAIEAAIEECQAVVDRAPQVRADLARLLIARNRRQPESQRDWAVVKRAIDDTAKAAPESIVPVILEAEALLAQDKAHEAADILEKAVARFPKSVEVRMAQAHLLRVLNRFDEAQKLLDRARDDLGDRVDLRLARAHLEATRTGPEVVKALNSLAENTQAFSKGDRRKLLEGLSLELVRQQDFKGAAVLQSRLADEEPNDLKLRLSLLDFAFQTATRGGIDGDSQEFERGRAEIAENIRQIERIEGSDGLQSGFSHLRFFVWQAAWSNDKTQQEAFRTQARELLKKLSSRRADSPWIPLALADLEEQELKQALKEQKLGPGDIREREETIVNHYLHAIHFGRSDLSLMRRAVDLLFKTNRGIEAVALLNRLPAESQLIGDLEQRAEQIALEQKDFQRAEQIARTAVEANPADFQARYRLVRILQESGRQADAESALRSAVDFAPGDPNRRIALVAFLVNTKQAEQAEQAVRDAAKAIPPSSVPLTLAQCCHILGQFYGTTMLDDAKRTAWYGEAKSWYERALAVQPNDVSIKRSLTAFLLDTHQRDQAKSRLEAILKQGPATETTGTYAWARRTLALIRASDTDLNEVRRALSLFESNDPVTPGQEGKTLEDPEDLRILAKVLDQQGRVPDVRIPLYRKRAIEILESLTDQKVANSEDEFLLAQLYDVSGDWPKALDAFRDLILRTKKAQDLETLNRRPSYLDRFAEGLLRRRGPGESHELTEAQEIVNELKHLQPDEPRTLVRQVEIYRAENQLDSAAQLIDEWAGRQNWPPALQEVLASVAEKFGQLAPAEKLYRQLAALPAPRGTLLLAQFLGRHDRVKEALDICEPLWNNNAGIVAVGRTCVDVVLSGKEKPDPAQLDRVCGWLNHAVDQPQNRPAKTLFLLYVGVIRERQELYQKAKDEYESAVKVGERNGLASAYSCLAWLTVLMDGNLQDALKHINHAIGLDGEKPDFLDTRGVIHLKMGEIRNAIVDLDKANTTRPSACESFHLAQAYLKSGNKEKAREKLETAKALGLPGVGQSGGLHSLELADYKKVLTELGER